jgi:hypothetical protein
MPKVDIANLIPYISGKADAPEVLNGVTPKHAVDHIRASCTDQGNDYPHWSAGILQHCIMPADHPYRALLKKREVPAGDPLWILGAIAYGTQSSWISFRRIQWEDGKVDLPDEHERNWIVKHGALRK